MMSTKRNPNQNNRIYGANRYFNLFHNASLDEGGMQLSWPK